LYGQPECLLSIRDALGCTAHANAISKLLADCGMAEDTVSCMPVDGVFLLVMSPVEEATGLLSKAEVEALTSGSVASFHFNQGFDAYPYWQSRPMLGEDTTVCTAIAKELHDAVNELHKWKSSAPNKLFGCSTIYLHGGVAEGGRYDSVDYLNTLLDESLEGNFPKCAASTTTQTSTATTSATSTATTTATTTLGRGSMDCTQTYGINMLSSNIGLNTCKEDGSVLGELIGTCTNVSNGLPITGDVLSCYKDQSVFVSVVREMCDGVATALTQLLKSHDIGGAIACVATGFKDANNNVISVLRPPASASGCGLTSELLNRLIVGFAEEGNCAVPTITTSTSTTFTTTTETKTTSIPLHPSLTLIFQTDIDSSVNAKRDFRDAVIASIMTTESIFGNELVDVNLFGGSVIAVLTFISASARDRAQSHVLQRGLAIFVNGQDHIGLVWGATAPPPTTTTATSITSTTIPTTATTTDICPALVDAVFNSEPLCRDIREVITRTTSTFPATNPVGDGAFNLEMEFHVSLLTLTGNKILGDTVREQLSAYFSAYLAIPVELSPENISFSDKTVKDYVDPSGCGCFSSLVGQVQDNPEWAACAVSSAGIQAPVTMGEYTLACASVDVPTRGDVTSIKVQLPAILSGVLANSIAVCELCPTFDLGVARTICANLPGQNPCVYDPTNVVAEPSEDTRADASTTAQWTPAAYGLLIGAALLLLGVAIVATKILGKLPDNGAENRQSASDELRELTAIADKIKGAVAARTRPDSTNSWAVTGAYGGKQSPAPAPPAPASNKANKLSGGGVEVDGAMIALANGAKFPALRSTFSPPNWPTLEGMTFCAADPLDASIPLARTVATAAKIAGKAVVVMRGNGSFVAKAKKVQDAGGTCCIIVNTAHQEMPLICQPTTLEEAKIPIRIPTVMVRNAEGVALITRLQRGTNVIASLSDNGYNGAVAPVSNVTNDTVSVALLKQSTLVDGTSGISAAGVSGAGYLDVARAPDGGKPLAPSVSGSNFNPLTASALASAMPVGLLDANADADGSDMNSSYKDSDDEDAGPVNHAPAPAPVVMMFGQVVPAVPAMPAVLLAENMATPAPPPPVTDNSDDSASGFSDSDMSWTDSDDSFGEGNMDDLDSDDGKALARTPRKKSVRKSTRKSTQNPGAVIRAADEAAVAAAAMLVLTAEQGPVQTAAHLPPPSLTVAAADDAINNLFAAKPANAPKRKSKGSVHGPVKQVMADQPHDAVDGSGELSFPKDAVMFVAKKISPEHWMGVWEGKTGLIPTSKVQRLVTNSSEAGPQGTAAAPPLTAEQEAGAFMSSPAPHYHPPTAGYVN
jgi:hypothetical protein